jgi:membrane peptidoglycan carboxypeptidase
MDFIMTAPFFPSYFLKKKIKKDESSMETILIYSLFFAAIFMLGFGVLSYLLRSYAQAIPSHEEIDQKVTEKGQNSYLYDRSGELLYVFTDPKRDREYASIEQIPEIIKWALIASEDANFYNHAGFDLKAITRSTFSHITDSDNKSGGSTITQQLAKNSILSSEQTIDRKIKEVMVSVYLEKQYSKDYILEMHLNSSSFGGRVIGIKAASRVYFNKSLDELSIQEAVFLISLIQRPGESSPLFATDQEQAWKILTARSNYIYDQLKKHLEYIKSKTENFYTWEEIDDASKAVVSLNPGFGEIKAPHFVFYIKSALQKEPYNISEEDLYNGGYKITTSLDYGIQKIAEKNIEVGVEKMKRYYFANNGSLITIDPENGEILAMVGSRDYWGKKDKDGKFDPQVNVVLSDRNMGSSLKPFLVYDGIKQGKYSPFSIISDSKISIYGYSPKNSDGSFMGNMTVSTALQLSRNTPFIRMIQNTGVDSFLNVLESLGYRNAEEDKRDRYGIAIALGGFDANLFEHTLAYATLANEGNLPQATPILKIETLDNEVIFEPNRISNQVLDPSVVSQVNNILLHYGPWKVAGKTGTTDGNKDTYFIGYTDKFLTGIWLGNNNNARMARTAFGSNTALPVWTRYYQDVIKDFPELDGQIKYSGNKTSSDKLIQKLENREKPSEKPSVNETIPPENLELVEIHPQELGEVPIVNQEE